MITNNSLKHIFLKYFSDISLAKCRVFRVVLTKEIPSKTIFVYIFCDSFGRDGKSETRAGKHNQLNFLCPKMARSGAPFLTPTFPW